MIAIQDNPDIRNPDDPILITPPAIVSSQWQAPTYLISSNDPTFGNSPTNGFKYFTNASVILFPSEINEASICFVSFATEASGVRNVSMLYDPPGNRFIA